MPVRRAIDKIREPKDGFQLIVPVSERTFTRAIRIAGRGHVIVHGRIAFESGSAEKLDNTELVRRFRLGL